jgi:hypothetical protein
MALLRVCDPVWILYCWAYNLPVKINDPLAGITSEEAELLLQRLIRDNVLSKRDVDRIARKIFVAYVVRLPLEEHHWFREMARASGFKSAAEAIQKRLAVRARLSL